MRLINIYFAAIFCGLSPALAFGQDFEISGNIIDESGLPVSFTNIILLQAQDSTIVSGTTSEDDGSFRLTSVRPADYILKASFIGFNDEYRTISVSSDMVLPDIVLRESAESLDEVEITYKRPSLRKEPDRLVFNIENTALSEGNVMDALRSTPGVLILDNAISVRNITPTVYINDRKVHISAEEISALLEGTPASTVSSIEVITNPSARYDADTGAVLNIVMNRNVIAGYSGSVFANYTQGVFPRENYGMTNLFKSPKVSFYINYNYANNKINRVNDEQIDYSMEEWHANIDRNIWSETHNANMNFDYSPADNHTISLSGTAIYLPYFKYRIKNTTDINNGSQNGFFSNNLSRDEKYDIGADLDYVYRFADSRGRLAINAHYTTYDYRRDQRVDSDNFFSDPAMNFSTAFTTTANQETEILTSQFDVTVPLAETVNFEAGAKYSNVITDSNIDKNDIVNGQPVPDLNNTDDFDYDEKVYAGYLNFDAKWAPVTLRVGLRVEQTEIEGISISNNVTNTQDYFEYFPSGHLGVDLTEKLTTYATYGRSIKRPDYTNLNPFQFFLNDNIVVVGNPDLQPVFTDNYVFGLSWDDRFTLEVYYQENAGTIFELPLQDNVNNTIAYTPINIEENNELGIDFLSYFNLTPNWSMSLVSSLYYVEEEAIFGTETVSLDRWSNYSEMTSNISFLKDNSLSANLTVTYITTNLQGLSTVDTRLLTELSIRKTILNGKGVLSVSASDLFNDHDFLVLTDYLDQKSSIFSNLDNRYIRAGFRFNFGNTRLTSTERTKSMDELERLKDISH